MVLSFPRKREPSQFNKLDSRFCGNDDLISVSLILSVTLKYSRQRREFFCQRANPVLLNKYVEIYIERL